MTKRPATSEHILRQLPTKWAIALIACLILYALLQPWVNQRFGWRLPSLNPNSPTDTVVQDERGEEFWANQAPMLQEEPESESAPESTTGSTPSQPSENDRRTQSNKTDAKAMEPKAASNAPSPTTPPNGTKPSTPNHKVSDAKGKESGPAAKNPSSPEKKNTSSSTSETSNAGKKFGILQETGRNRFQSPAGLIYAPGSEEGHRLKHIEKHLSDQPNRPGKHGVFDGDMEAVVRWIDDAYQRSMRKAKGTSMRDEDGRTVIEASFEKPIGYIGGRDGNRMRQPPAKRLRLVVDGKNVITAFPF